MSIESSYEHEVMVLREQCDNGEITDQEYDDAVRDLEDDRRRMENEQDMTCW